MVKREEILELGFTPGYEYTQTDHSFIMGNRHENPYIPWIELMIMYDFSDGDCGIYFSDSSKNKYKKKMWRGKISSIDELEDKLQELNGEY